MKKMKIGSNLLKLSYINLIKFSQILEKPSYYWEFKLVDFLSIFQFDKNS